MDIKNVCNAQFLQIDNRIQNISFVKGVEILPSLTAWQNYPWCRKYFSHKPRGGYFIWVKEKISFPLVTCVSLTTKNVFQNLTNLIIIEKNLDVTTKGICNSLANNLSGTHIATGKIILKEGARLNYLHWHKWSHSDIVQSNYEFIGEKNSKLLYSYQNLFSPSRLSLKTNVAVEKKAQARLEIVIKGKRSKINLEESINLQGKDAQGAVYLKLAGEKGSDITGISRIYATAPSKGHLDCQGLVIDKGTTISLVPQLVCSHKQALVTHEASIGRINEDQLLYLRSRGLNQKEATELIVDSFLKK